MRLIIAFVLAPAVAAAQPSAAIPMTPLAPAPSPQRLFVGGAVLLGGDKYVLGGLDGEAGVRIVGPLWGHARAAVGGTADPEGGGDFWQIEGGAELHLCDDAERWCFVAGAGAGLERKTWRSANGGDYPDEDFRGPIVSGTLALDLAARNTPLHVRFGLELFRARLDEGASGPHDRGGVLFFFGGAFAQ